MQKTPPMNLNTSPTCFEGCGTGKHEQIHKTLKNLKLAPKKQLGTPDRQRSRGWHVSTDAAPWFTASPSGLACRPRSCLPRLPMAAVEKLPILARIEQIYKSEKLHTYTCIWAFLVCSLTPTPLRKCHVNGAHGPMGTPFT